MEDNIFKRLRLERTQKIVMQGEGRKIPVPKPLSGTELADKMNIHQTTVSNAENGIFKSLSTYIAYHDYFHVPYSTLFGETDIMDINNLTVNKELGLSDDSITTIKNLSPIARSMLNVLLSKQHNTDNFFNTLAEYIFSMYMYLNDSETSKNDESYQQLRKLALHSFEDYMKTITFQDLKKVLIALDEQQQMISEHEYSSEELTEMDNYFEESKKTGLNE